MYAARNNNFTLLDCQAHGFHKPTSNKHPVGNYTKSFSNNNNCNFTQNVGTYYYCAPSPFGGEAVRDYGMRDCKIEIANNSTNENRSITINFLYNRKDLILQDKAPPKPDTNFTDATIFGGDGNQGTFVPHIRSQSYDGDKLKTTIKNNFEAKPTYPTILSSTTTLPPNFKTSIWGISSLINDNNPYLKCFFWQSNAATTFG